MSHTVYADHTDSFKIIFKIFVKMSSRKAILKKISPKARYSSAFSVKIFFKDYNEIDYFLRQQHLNKDFLQDF